MDQTETPLRVVCDAGPLIHLDELGCLDSLSDFGDVLVPSVVWAEVQRHRPTALQHLQIRFMEVVPHTPMPIDLDAVARVFSLHEGERQALHVTLEQNPDLLVTDDTAARLAARSFAITVHGTIGILLRSIRRRYRTAPEVAAILRSLPALSTLHVKPSLLDEIVEAVERLS